MTLSRMRSATFITALVAWQLFGPCSCNAAENQTSDAEAQDKLEQATGNAAGWSYSNDTDVMENLVVHKAVLTNINAYTAAHPTRKPLLAGLIIARHGKDIYVCPNLIGGGQFVCSSNCEVSVKFDDGPVEKFPANLPSDGRTNILYLGNTNKFFKELSSSKVTIIRVTIFNDGDEDLWYSTKGLKLG